jgi:dipeptidyl aminopeptidase/acylaminoacyl peptidase
MRRLQWCALALLALVAEAGAGQERTLPLPSTVTVDGVPPIPMSLVEAVAPYSQFRQARLVAWHPAERRMVIATTFGNAPQLHHVRFPGGARTQLTFFGDGVASRPGAVFGAKGDSIVFQKDTAGGGEANQLFRYDFGTGRITLLTDGKSRNGVPVVSRGGLIAYDSTRRDGKNRDLYVVSPGDPSSARLVAQTEGAWSVLDWSPDEKAILAAQMVSSSETYLWRVEVAAGQKTLVSPKSDRPVRWSAAAFAPDGETVLAVGNHLSDHARLWRLSRGTATPITGDAQIIDNFAMSRDGKTIAVVLDLGSTTQLELIDSNGRSKARPALPAGVISDLLWHPTRNEVGFSLAGARAFNDVYSADASTGRAERWTFSEMGGANAETLPDAEIVKWNSFDGVEISGVLYPPHPRFTGPRPVIINVHGGPSERERPRAIGRSNYFRNELGIAVIYPNIRGSLGFGRAFEELDNGRLREHAVKDIDALLDWIARQPSLDKMRVMIAGASYGGYVALASGIEYGDRLRGVNPAFAITDFPSYLESTEISRQANRNAEYGDPSDPEMRAFLTRISPLTNVARLKLPVFIAAGAKDTRIPISQAEMLVKALKATGTPVWYVRFEDAGHQQLTPATNDFSIYTWIMFVRKYLVN